MLTPVLTLSEAQCHEIRAERLSRKQVSRTFHGRGIYAPVGAMLASGKWSFGQVGPICTDPVLGPARPQLMQKTRKAKTTVVHVDHFGNLITGLHRSDCADRSAKSVQVEGQGVDRFVELYAQAASGSTVALWGSGNLLEVSVVNGNAADRLDAGVGTTVEVEFQFQSPE